MATLPTSIRLEIVTPEKMLVREDVEEVVVPGEDGYLGVLPGHTPLLATLKIGDLWYRKGQEKTHVPISGGFAEVLPDRVTILAEVAAPAEIADAPRA
jgi:F-type H+-transporting ATPase subunit epsilon